MTFMYDFLAGRCRADDIDDYIAEWHWSPVDQVHLHSFLGMTYSQYAAWFRDPDSLTGAYGTDPSD